jgi:hypothetical protein
MTRARFSETTVADALKGSVGPLMRQIRKYAALKGLLAALPSEMAQMAAPYDVKLAVHKEDGPIQGRPLQDGAGQDGAGGKASAGATTELNPMYIYVASPTVATVISQRKRALIEAANCAAGMPLVEDLRCEQAPQAKITRQLNILGLKPD